MYQFSKNIHINRIKSTRKSVQSGIIAYVLRQ
nr:MAG TPA: hypothetical protein [Siphoviridae sp. ctgbm9]